ncbi:helix-turn-helix domain-containing protein [Streptomyces gamaensis]|uniref:Helix-turn-helix domain-containing protein n=1 Tax=Streptomyces gamaensis TaxID=1763542 RepID=A0ABW0Z2A6_9ACTN
MMEMLFDTSGLPAPDRVDAWMETAATALVPTRISPLTRDSFAGRMRALHLGAAQVNAMAYTSLCSRRTPALIRRSDPEQYQIALIRSGCQGIEQAGSNARLRKGDLVLYDSSRPFEATADGGQGTADSVLLQFPKRLLALPGAKVAALLAVPLKGTEGVGRLLAQFMTALAEEDVRHSPGEAERLGVVALDLATAVLAHHLDGGGSVPRRTPQYVLFLRVQRFVRQHLGDPGLSPDAIAAAHAISTRYLHRLFQQQHLTVGSWIRGQRLEQCRRALADPAQRHTPVHEIAARWGFGHPAAFSRNFRAAYGISPTEYREAATAARVSE